MFCNRFKYVKGPENIIFNNVCDTYVMQKKWSRICSIYNTPFSLMTELNLFNK